MPRLVAVFAFTLLLAGCQALGMGGDEPAAAKGGPVLGDAVTVTALDAPTSATPATPEPDPVPQPAPPRAIPAAETEQTPDAATAEAAPAGLPEPAPPPKSAAELACEAQGGTWGKAGATSAMTCFQPTRDAGKSCRRESDCSTLCLARSRTCAPITPLFGCHPVLQDDGREVTLCTD